MIQIISLVIIGGLSAFVLIRNKERISILKMVLTGIFLTIALIVNYFSFNLMFLGSQVVVRFSQLILIVLGGSLGPVYALIGGFAFDPLNLFLNPLGSFYAGFTLNNILVTLIPAFLFKKLSTKKEGMTFSILVLTALSYITYIIVVLLLFLNIGNVDDVNASQLASNALIFMFIFLIVLVVSLIIVKKKNIKLDNDFMILMITVILVELIIQGFLTPLWLSDMAGTPMLISMQIRAIKGIPMILINGFLGYPILKLVRRNITK